jgi:tungstate transport system ATP-binding protein
MTAPVLEMDDLVVRAGAKNILDVARFTVAADEIVALIGPNGAGKSTLLHAAALLRQVDAGMVTILGETASARNAAALRRSLSLVWQDPLLFDVSVLANVAAGLRFRGRSRAEADRQAMYWLEQFGVAHLSQRRSRELSGGEASRVALARAFATEPALLLLDEPFSALDAPTRAPLLPALRDRLRETGAAAVLVTHDLGEAFAFGDRLALMDQGRILATGKGPALMARPPSRRAAELLGIETILAATVVCADEDFALVELQPRGPAVRVRPPANAADEGQHVTFVLSAIAARAIRPETKHLVGENVIPGIVSAVTHGSSGTKLTVSTPAPLVAMAPWEPFGEPWVIGDRAVVAFPEGVAQVLPAMETGTGACGLDSPPSAPRTITYP